MQLDVQWSVLFMADVPSMNEHLQGSRTIETIVRKVEENLGAIGSGVTVGRTGNSAVRITPHTFADDTFSMSFLYRNSVPMDTRILGGVVLAALNENKPSSARPFVAYSDTWEVIEGLAAYQPEQSIRNIQRSGTLQDTRSSDSLVGSVTNVFNTDPIMSTDPNLDGRSAAGLNAADAARFLNESFNNAAESLFNTAKPVLIGAAVLAGVLIAGFVVTKYY
jgi:hypothetical protein